MTTIGYYMFSVIQRQGAGAEGMAAYPQASALGLCCTAVAIPLTFLFRKFAKRFEE
jgi:hypothetical protein